MAFRKTAEERAEGEERKAAESYAASPVGQAAAARQRGDAFFQVELDISVVGGGSGPGSAYGQASGFGSSSNTIKRTGGRPDLLGQIEEVGWRLEHVGYVFVETGATTSNRLGGTGQGVVTRGKVVGIYLFRARV
jgi:hypothetical protein